MTLGAELIVADERQRAKNRSLADTAYDLIKRDIVHCEIAPGSQVTEEQLGERYDVGRAGVRAALKRLYQEKLVTLSRRGYFIAPITLKHVNDVFQIRTLLEPAAARLAAGNIDPQLLRHLDELCQAQYKPGDPKSAEDFLSANTEFHLAIAGATGNVLLYDTLASLFDKVERVHHLGHILHDRNEEAYHEHHELVEALLAGDAAGAERVMADQIEAARKFVIDAMVASPSVQSVNVTAVSKRSSSPDSS
jgi:DNA-binding GntR family transcriptional regulator